eukprot:4093551-Amphidinium_carterae.1
MKYLPVELMTEAIPQEIKTAARYPHYLSNAIGRWGTGQAMDPLLALPPVVKLFNSAMLAKDRRAMLPVDLCWNHCH